MIGVSEDFKTAVKSDTRELSAYIKYDAGTGENGTLTNFARNNGAVTAPVTIDDGIVFNGAASSGGIVIANNTVDVTANSFVSLWVTVDSRAMDYMRILDAAGTVGSTLIWMTNTDNIVLSNIGTGDTTIAATYGTPMNIILSFEETETNIYVNGVLHGSADSVPPAITEWYMGNRTARDRTLDGTIHNFSVGSKTISLAEAQQIYAAGKDAYSPISSGLVAQYSGRDYAGTEALPTTIYDTNMIVEGKWGEAVSFDGVDDYIVTPSSSDFVFEDEISIGAWIYIYNVTGTKQIVNAIGSGRRNFQLTVTGSNLRFLWRNAENDAWRSFSQDITAFTNQWVFVGVTHKFGHSDKSNLIINGVPYPKTGNTDMPYVHTTNPLSIGSMAGSESFQGSISQMVIYKRILSTQEVLNLYNYQKDYYNFNSSGNVIYHRLGAGDINHATDVATGTKLDRIHSEFDLKGIKLLNEGDVCGTMLRQVEGTYWGDYDLLGEEVNLGIGAEVEGETEEIDYGTFKIDRLEQKRGVDQITAIGYDKMIEALTQYDLTDLTFPMSLKDFLDLICDRLEWELASTSFHNDDLELESDVFFLKGLTYREVLDQIAEATGSLIYFGTDNKLYLEGLSAVQEEVPPEDLKELDVEEKWGEFNSLVLAENPVETNFVYDGGYYGARILLENGDNLLLENSEPLRHEKLYEIEGLYQMRFENNLLLSGDRAGLIGDLKDSFSSFEFYPYKAKTIGLGYFEVGDNVKLIDFQGNEFESYVSGVTLELVDGGLKEILKMTPPYKSRTNTIKSVGAVKEVYRSSQADTSNIKDNSITTIKIADASITNAKITELTADKITTGELQVGVEIIIPDDEGKALIYIANVEE